MLHPSLTTTAATSVPGPVGASTMPGQPDQQPAIVARVCRPEGLGVGHQGLEVLLNCSHVKRLHGFDVGLRGVKDRQGLRQASSWVLHRSLITPTTVLQYRDAAAAHLQHKPAAFVKLYVLVLWRTTAVCAYGLGACAPYPRVSTLLANKIRLEV